MKLATCHPNRKVKNKTTGLCGACYDKLLRERNPTYKAKQRSNWYKWKEANPDKYEEHKRRTAEKRAKDPVYKAKRRKARLLKQYGITEEEYNQILKAQNGGCALCQRKPGKTKLHVDHCHKTGRVRGILCHQCNWYMGTIDADPTILQRIIKYREQR